MSLGKRIKWDYIGTGNYCRKFQIYTKNILHTLMQGFAVET